MATGQAEAKSREVGSRGFRVSLGGLMVLVLAAGLAAGVVRSSKEVWGVRGVPAPTSGAGSPVWAGGEVPVERTAGVVLEVAGVFLVVVLRAHADLAVSFPKAPRRTRAENAPVEHLLATGAQPAFSYGLSH